MSFTDNAPRSTAQNRTAQQLALPRGALLCALLCVLLCALLLAVCCFLCGAVRCCAAVGSIYAALRSPRCPCPRGRLTPATAAQVLMDGAQPGEVNDTYLLVLLALQCGCASLARRFLAVALLTANPDLCFLTDAPPFEALTRDFLDDLAVVSAAEPLLSPTAPAAAPQPTPAEALAAAAGELSVPQLWQLLALDYRTVVADQNSAADLFADPWDRGCVAVRFRDFATALAVFTHCRPLSGPADAPLYSGRVAAGLLLLSAREQGIAEADVLQRLLAMPLRTPQQPGPRQWLPLAGGGRALVGHTARQMALAAVCPETHAQRVIRRYAGRSVGRYSYAGATARACECPSATGLLGRALGLPRIVFVDCAADPNRQTGSRLHPFCTVQNALPRARAGDTILLLPGHYAPILLQNVRCPCDAPLTVRGTAAAAVLVGHPVPGSMQPGVGAVELRACSGVVLSDLTLCNAKSGALVDGESVYVRLADLDVRGCHHATTTPDPHNHVIAATGLVMLTSPGRGRRAFDALVLRMGIAPCLSHWWNVPFLLLILAVSVASSVGILAYAEAFYQETGNNTKVTAWVVSSWLVILLDVFVKQPLLVFTAFGVLYLLSML